MSTAVPTLNIQELDSDTERFVDALGSTYMQFGFCGISGHGISPSLISESYRQVEAFFALPLADKQKYHIPGVGGARGYTALGVETARDSKHPDLKEFWHVGLDLDGEAPHQSLYPNVWPTEIPGFEPALKQLGWAIGVFRRWRFSATGSRLLCRQSELWQLHPAAHSLPAGTR